MDRRNQPFYWVIPQKLAGMPFPFLSPERRLAGDAGLFAFADDLPVLYQAGIRAVVALVNLTSDRKVYEAAGMSFLCLPVPDGHPPARDQVAAFISFADGAIERGDAVAVHCHAGLGRTGTMLAAYLICKGHSPEAAIAKVRVGEPAAVETVRQVEFLKRLAGG